MGSLAKDPGFAGHIAGVTKALGHPIRLRIVALLCEGELNVGSLAEALGSPQAIVSQQLRILRMSGLVSVARVDGKAVYGLAEPRLRQLLRCLEKCSIS